MNGETKVLSSAQVKAAQDYRPAERVGSDGTVLSSTTPPSDPPNAFIAPTVQGLQVALLPPASVLVGQTWSAPLNIAKQQFVAVYVLSGVTADSHGDQIMTIDATLTDAKPRTNLQLPTGAVMSVRFAGYATIHFDNTMGLLQDSTVTTKGTVTLQTPGPDGGTTDSNIVNTIAFQRQPVSATPGA